MGIFTDMVNQIAKQHIKEMMNLQQEILNAQRNRQSNSTQSQKNTTRPTEWNLDVLMSLEWKRYEEVCKEIISLWGYDARLTKMGADGGVDIEIYRDNKLYGLVQCKAWIAKVGIKEIRELYGVMASKKITDGTFFTTSSYTQEAFTFARDNKIDLHDGNSLITEIKSFPTDHQKKLLDFATTGDYTTPTCPNCGVKLIRRSGEKKDFWGCVFFPRCKGKLQMRNT